MPKAARKTKSAKPQPKPKAEKVKRKALRNIDNEEVKSKKVNRVTKSKKNSQEQVVEVSLESVVWITRLCCKHLPAVV
jgi:hypothetical protein